MKKFFSTMAVAALLLAGVTSCAKDGEVTEAGTGNLTVNFSFDDATSRAISDSNAKPKTSWGNLTNMMILFTDGAGLVQDARAIPVPVATAPMTGHQPAVFTDVKANSAGWTAYIVGNYPSDWTTSNVVGQNISALSFTAPSNQDAYGASGLAAVTATAYAEAPEVFVSKQTGVIIQEGTNNEHTTPFKLARAVSQLRLRVDKDGSTQNSTVNFTTGVLFAVRRATVSYAMNGTYGPVDNYGADFPGVFAPASPAGTNAFFSTKVMQTANPSAATYENPTTIVTGDVDFWNDYLIWAGGGSSTESAKRFDIVIGAMAPAGYVPFGTTVPLTAPTMVYWDGAVDGKMGPNQILEVNVTLKEAGTVTPPPVGAYGNLQVTVDIVGWGNIIHAIQEM